MPQNDEEVSWLSIATRFLATVDWLSGLAMTIVERAPAACVFASAAPDLVAEREGRAGRAEAARYERVSRSYHRVSRGNGEKGRSFDEDRYSWTGGAAPF